MQLHSQLNKLSWLAQWDLHYQSQRKNHEGKCSNELIILLMEARKKFADVSEADMIWWLKWDKYGITIDDIFHIVPGFPLLPKLTPPAPDAIGNSSPENAVIPNEP